MEYHSKKEGRLPDCTLPDDFHNPLDRLTNDAIVLDDDDAVATALRPLAAGRAVTLLGQRIVIAEDIPAGHKFAFKPIVAGTPVLKYGHPIGRAVTDIAPGRHVHLYNLHSALDERIDDSFSEEPASLCVQAPASATTMIDAYVRDNGQIAIRNEIWIIPTVGCVAQVASALAVWGNERLADRTFTGIDAFTALEHPYGCSQLGVDHERTRTVLAALAAHPHAAGVLLVGLGCENNTMETFLEMLDGHTRSKTAWMVCQHVPDEFEHGTRLLAHLATLAGQARRTAVPLGRLVVGLKCGGSDGLSGITANVLAGLYSDMLTSCGGRTILTEVPEMFGAESILAKRCADNVVRSQLISIVETCKRTFTNNGLPVYENPSPGNKAGGITTLEEKSLGCVRKGGSSPVVAVIPYGGTVRPAAGLQVLEGPGNDQVSITALAAAHAHLILFTTGRGTPLGTVVPTIKISSNTPLADAKRGWIDMDAGMLMHEDPHTVLERLALLLQEVASGRSKTRNELNRNRSIAILKDGVTL